MKKPAEKKSSNLGGVFGHPVCAVVRRLGKEGLSTAHVRAMIEAKGVKVSATTVSIQVNAGRSKDSDRGEPADLTAAQVKELIADAPDPAKAEPKDSKKQLSPPALTPVDSFGPGFFVGW